MPNWENKFKRQYHPIKLKWKTAYFLVQSIVIKIRSTVIFLCVGLSAFFIACSRDLTSAKKKEIPFKPSPDAKAEACKECHSEIYELWHASQHARALRPLDPLQDDAAFIPTRTVYHGTITSTLSKVKNTYRIRTLGPDGQTQDYIPEAVIALDPLRQYLIPFPDGRFQVTELAYDPHQNDWFDVFGEENRQPHEWGYWANRGMTWNVQCAFCHMTNLKKNYAPESDTYNTTWDASGISCSQCHGVISGTNDCPRVFTNQRTPSNAMQQCASCHTRRDELTGRYDIGDSFFDHYRPVLPDVPNIYYPDGQVQDEDFEYGSFLLSRKGNKGITCLDCHDPHSGKLVQPIENNTLCLTCHIPPGLNGAKPVDPVAHSFHKLGTPGSLCVDCHMPITKYMVRDPRRDHGFTIPDPLLTKQFNIPNACNRCHADKTVDWALQWTETWYSNKMERLSRRRAQVMARAFREDEENFPDLLSLANTEEIPAWKATLLSMLAPWGGAQQVQSLYIDSLNDSNALVRASAARNLALHPNSFALLQPLLKDPVRMVRLDAAWSLIGRLNPQSEVYKELIHYLAHNSDQPSGCMRQAQLALAENRSEDALKWTERALKLESNSPYLYHFYGIVLNRNQKNEASLQALNKAFEMEPENPQHPFSMALLYGEMGRNDKVVEMLKKAITIDPTFHRAWYNLALVYAKNENLNDALETMQQAEKLAPDVPDYPYARATLHLRQKNPKAAKEAALKSLQIAPDYTPARQLLENQIKNP